MAWYLDSARQWLGVALVGLTCMTGSPQAEAKSVALLVGVGRYSLVQGADLEGPVHDVQALRDVLIRRWGFAQSDVVTLTDAQATREDIMGELRRLMARTQAGDEVLVYFSGHGTSALDSATADKLELASGTGVFLPTDFAWGADMQRSTQGMIIGRRDLRPIFSELETKGRSLVVLADACYSGESVRALGAPSKPSDLLPKRWLPQPSALVFQANMRLTPKTSLPDPYPYQATAYLAAAAESEPAKDIPKKYLEQYPTLDGKPHGAMTDALLRVLEGKWVADFNGDGWLDLNELHRSVSEYMDGRSYDQTPQRLPNVYQDSTGVGNRKLFGTPNRALKPEGDAVVRRLRVVLPANLHSSLSEIKGMDGIDLVTDGQPDVDLLIVDNNGELVFLGQGADTIATVPHNNPKQVMQQIQQLAWTHRIQQLAQAYRGGAMPTQVMPTYSGGRFYYGQKLAFVMRPEQSSYLLLLNVDSQGKVTVLYPRSSQETKVIPRQEKVMIPSDDLEHGFLVGAPTGMDIQLVFAFNTPTPELVKLINISDANVNDARLGRLEQLLQTQKGKFSFASTRTWAIPLPTTNPQANPVVLSN